MENLRLSFFEVFNSNFNILNTLRQFSLQIAMHYQKTLFKFIPKYFMIRNSSFQENAKTKVYALEDSLGVDLPTLIGRTGLFPILGVLNGIFHFIPNLDRTFASFQALKPEPVRTPCSVVSDLGLYCFHMPLKDASLGCVKVP